MVQNDNMDWMDRVVYTVQCNPGKHAQKDYDCYISQMSLTLIFVINIMKFLWVRGPKFVSRWIRLVAPEDVRFCCEDEVKIATTVK